MILIFGSSSSFCALVWAAVLGSCFAGVLKTADIPDATTNWKEAVPTKDSTFPARNAHASCVFKGKIWITGGKVDAYTMYNLQTSYKVADVWSSEDATDWTREDSLIGDFWAQNDDAAQPGPVAPWYERFGHTLDPLDIDGDGTDDVMILMGGYAPEPSNDMWVSPDGRTWIYAGFAPWSPRAWHGTARFQDTLWLVGGSPLNNEVWKLDSFAVIDRRTPLTRSMYVNYTYSFQWTQVLESASWSPRVGMGLVSHWWFNDTAGQTVDASQEYLVLIGGFGGWTNTSSLLYDGMHGRNDVWITLDGSNWTAANPNASFDGRGWMAVADLHGDDKRLSSLAPSSTISGEIYLTGGGDIGFSTSSTQTITQMDGKLDAYWSRDMVVWHKINFQEGGGRPSEIQRLYSSKNLPQYSSQEWSRTTVDSEQIYLGLWGHSMETFNSATKLEVGKMASYRRMSCNSC
jgi:hypothetical protein